LVSNYIVNEFDKGREVKGVRINKKKKKTKRNTIRYKTLLNINFIKICDFVADGWFSSFILLTFPPQGINYIYIYYFISSIPGGGKGSEQEIYFYPTI